MTSNNEKLLVIVDPNDDHHTALERAIITAKIRTPSPKLYVLVTTDSEDVDTRAVNTNLLRNERWFKEVIRNPLDEAGLDYTLYVTWSTEWQASIMQAAKNVDADSILMPDHHRNKSTKRLFFTESKWELLKGAACPVILIRPGAREKRKTILAAVNFQAVRDAQKLLNTDILNEAKRFADGYGADLHVVNAYYNSMNYPDRGQLANQTHLPPSNIHVEQGYSNDVIAKLAEKLDADLVVMGTLGQWGQTKTRRGNTAERIISALATDVMIVNH